MRRWPCWVCSKSLPIIFGPVSIGSESGTCRWRCVSLSPLGTVSPRRRGLRPEGRESFLSLLGTIGLRWWRFEVLLGRFTCIIAELCRASKGSTPLFRRWWVLSGFRSAFYRWRKFGWTRVFLCSFLWGLCSVPFFALNFSWILCDW
jgi:hypothetical protein